MASSKSVTVRIRSFFIVFSCRAQRVSRGGYAKVCAPGNPFWRPCSRVCAGGQFGMSFSDSW
jgi:hypothetical protein